MKMSTLLAPAVILGFAAVLIAVAVPTTTSGMPKPEAKPLTPYNSQADVNATIEFRVRELEEHVALLTDRVNELTLLAAQIRLAVAAALSDPKMKTTFARVKGEIGTLPALSRARKDYSDLQSKLRALESAPMKEPIPRHDIPRQNIPRPDIPRKR